MFTPFAFVKQEVSAPAFVGLLDDYPNAELAYSFRRLRSAYTGSCIRVRRSSDDVEQDIGFVNNELDTSALTSFIGANNGLIRTWYDQSGNANNAVQTTNGDQSRLVIGGTVESIGSKPALEVDGKLINLTSNVTVSRYTSLIVGKKYATGDKLNGITGDVNAPLLSHWSDSLYYFQWPVNYIQTNAAISNANHEVIIASTTSDTTATISRNGSTLASTRVSFPSITSTLTRLFSYGGQTGKGKYQELIVWDSEQDANFTGIQNNINDYYAIY
jgi:hypothetical protein